MPDMKNSITKAVLFTIRDIENRDYFKGVSPEPSQALIDYFISRDDALTSWLNNHVQAKNIVKISDEPSIDKYKSISEDIQKNADEFESAYYRVYVEERSLIESISKAENLGELQAIKASFLSAYEEVQETELSKWELIYSFICDIPDADSSEIDEQQESHKFSIEDYYQFASTSLDSNDTYCDKERPLVQHRLGWYHKEDDKSGTSVCAVYPWVGETNVIHNVGWANALLSTIKNEYPSIKSILLVCHDRDFNGFSGKDEVVTQGLFNDLKKKFPQLSSLIVFQHSNSTITGALKTDNANDVFNAIEEYANGYNTLKMADEQNLNAKAHMDFYNNEATNEGGKK